jgi:hypothetical protein
VRKRNASAGNGVDVLNAYTGNIEIVNNLRGP